jgi:hypothetical protein
MKGDFMPRIRRIRYIPAETVDISSDHLLLRDEEHLITEWKPIRPRADIHGGISCVFLSKGIKVSQFLDARGALLYWYIDLVEVRHDPATDAFDLHDLLADVRVMPDGRVEVIDLDELADALEQQLITPGQGVLALRILHQLLHDLQTGVQPALAASWMLQAKQGARTPQDGHHIHHIHHGTTDSGHVD